MVFRTAYRMTGNAADAEDIFQQVFLRLIRRGNTAEPLENQESYLRRAAINLSLDAIRNRQDARSVPLDDAPPLHSVLDDNQRNCGIASAAPSQR